MKHRTNKEIVDCIKPTLRSDNPDATAIYETFIDKIWIELSPVILQILNQKDLAHKAAITRMITEHDKYCGTSVDWKQVALKKINFKS